MVIDNSCANDADCEQGVCDARICIDGSTASVDVALEVLRSPSDVSGLTPASWMFSPHPASGATLRDLDLPPTRQVQGTVRWNGTRIPATLRFVRRMAEPLEPTVVEVETLRETAGGAEPADFDYSVILVASQTYDVVVWPTTDMVTAESDGSTPAVRSLPPLYLELAMDDADPAEPFRFDVEFPSDLGEPCTVDDNVGCTLEAQVLTVDDGEPVPEPGLQVRAIDVNDGHVVSSIGETGDAGLVSIRINDTASDYLIRVTSSVGRAPFPAVSVDPEVAFANDPNDKVIYIPRLTPIQVSGRVRDENDSPVPGATVRFFSTGIFDNSQLGLQGSFSASATTDEDGVFGTELLAGFYSVSVTPPADADNTWGVLTAEAAVGGELTTIEALIVPSQIQLRGWVTTFREEVAPGLTIVARARSVPESLVMHRSQEVVSNSIGAFTMNVDEGVYDVHVKVPSETGFPWLVEPDLSMSADDGALARVYRLMPPIAVRGVLRASDGSPVEGAMIRGYVLLDDGAQTRRVQIGEAASDEEGSYQLLIAPGFGGR
jgi:hypothetical protein